MTIQGTARCTHPLETARASSVTLYAHVTGGGAAANCTLDAQSALNGEITALTYSGSTGIYTGTFRYVYPALVGSPIISWGGEGTAGLFGKITAIDVTAGTFTAKFYVNNTLTDLATTDIPYFTWTVRTSSRNP
jgi:hypothetical protein